MLYFCHGENFLSYGTCPYYWENECKSIKKYAMQSNHTYGYIIVRKDVLENIVSQDISIFNNKTGEVNVNYQ